ncbi:MAG: hypothetical protein Fur0041_13750 [Bacteroidia bacterium]
MKRILFPVLLLSAVALIFDGCTKKDDTPDSETTSATDNSLCEGEFLRILPTVNKIAIDEPGIHRWGGNPTPANCPVISVDTPNVFPATLTIDYGTGCTDPVDGKVRKGKLVVELNMPWDSVGCIMQVHLDSFYVGAIHFEGDVTYTRTGASTFTKVINNGHCSKGGNTPWEIFWNCNRTINWTSGIGNSQAPQIVTITGTNSGTDRNGKNWSSTITSPLTRDLSCTWVTKGTIELTPEGKAVRTIDFGDGTCDNRGTITIEGNSFEFTMQ